MRVTTRIAREFGRAFSDELRGSPDCDQSVGSFCACLSDVASDGAAGPDEFTTDAGHPALAHLEAGKQNIAAGNAFREIVRNIAPGAKWVGSYGGDERQPGFGARTMAAQLIGRSASLRSDDVRAGLYLMAPNTVYPLHDHAADEIYYVVSGSVAICHGFESPWLHHGPGQFSRTPAYMPHTLRTRDEPVLIAWAWINDVNVMSYWWHEEQDGRWLRYLPNRPGAAHLMVADNGSG